MKKHKYGIAFYHKYGDELVHFLDEEKDDPALGLMLWATEVEHAFSEIKKLAKRLKGKEVEIESNTQFVEVRSNDPDLVSYADSKGLIQKINY